MTTPVVPARPERFGSGSGRDGEPPVEPTTTHLDAPGRRTGYVVAIAVNLVVLWAVFNVEAWHLTRFLSDDFDQVLPFVIASLAVSIAANVVYLVVDRTVVRSLGELFRLFVGLVSLIKALQVFPFDFTDYAIDWAPLLRIVLVLGIVGSVIGLAVATGKLVKAAVVDTWDPSP